MRIKYLPKPEHMTLQWHITDRCNWNCKHCYQKGEYLNKEMSFDELLKVLDDYLRLLRLWEVPGRINVTGGEPFVRKDFFNLLEKFSEHGDLIKYAVMTNGSFITKDIAERLKELNVELVQLSLEGGEKTNDNIRGKGTYNKIITAAKILVEEGITTSFSFTSNKTNYKEFDKVSRIAKEIGVNFVWSDRMVPYGEGKALKKDMMTPSELKEFYKSMFKSCIESYYNKSKTKIHAFRALNFLAYEKQAKKTYICPVGESIIIVMPNGDVMPCRRLPVVIGNLKNQSLTEIWYSNEFLWRLRDKNEISQKCRNCKYFEKCMGGARCISYCYSGNAFSPDPQCWIAFEDLPSPIELRENKPEGKKEFLPRFPESYECKENAKEEEILSEPKCETNDKTYNVTSKNLRELKNKLIKDKPEKAILFFDLYEDDLHENTGQRILDFLIELKEAEINFLVANPLPKCLIEFSNYKAIEALTQAKSCRDCLELFKINNKNEIELCNGRKGPKKKYLSNRNQIYELFCLFRKKTDLVKTCKECMWLLRGECEGLCIKKRKKPAKSLSKSLSLN
jgi:radical SAM protein with 4Fe4S-binding SPASM domain